MENIVAKRMVNICKHVQVSYPLFLRFDYLLFNLTHIRLFSSFLDECTDDASMCDDSHARSKRVLTKVSHYEHLDRIESNRTVLCVNQNELN